MSVLEHLEPKGVFHYFEEMCAIPHGSRNTKAISDWCVAFVKEHGLEYYQDDADNVIIIKEATPGYENAAPIILQGHTDMVCEKEADCPLDMEKDGLDLVVEGNILRARGTTLGGDDGIAVAIGLAALAADDLQHPRLEVLLTSDEEIGMLGAEALDASPLQGRQMLNLDSEDEGVFTVSCAGGSEAACTIPVMREAFTGAVLRVNVAGLSGGHSGVEIHKGRANADMLMGRLLRAAAAKTELRLVRVDGGLKDNAIPVAAEGIIVVADAAAASAAVLALGEAMANEYRVSDPGLKVTVQEAAEELLPMDAVSTRRILCWLTCAPNGVQAMSMDIPGLVQTSLNLGILQTHADKVTTSFSVRSSVDSQKRMLHDRIRCLVEELGGSMELFGDYPGWEYRPESPLRERMKEVFEEQYGYEPKVEAIHAGLECGLLSAKLPGLDCVSVGPNLKEIHTPRERLEIDSVQRLWAFVVEVLRRSK